MKPAFYFPNGFANEAENTYKGLRYYGMTPKWKFTKNDRGWQVMIILLSETDIACARQMPKFSPWVLPDDWTMPSE